MIDGDGAGPDSSDEDFDQENGENSELVPIALEEVASSANSSTVPLDAEELIETRRRLYEEYAKGKVSTSKAAAKKQAQELAPEIMDFVNAKSRGFGCRRAPIKIYFDSFKACEFFSSSDQAEVDAPTIDISDRPL